jgi:monoamine oxidase
VARRSWPGSPAALAAYFSRVEVTNGLAAGAGAWAGLMEGALRSGARAAGEVLARA